MHQGSGTQSLELLAVVALLLVAIRHRHALARPCRALARRIRPPRLQPLGRPIEDIAFDARRLRVRFRYPPAGIRFAKYEGLRCAYDRVLAEACTALDHPHLFDVVRPGTELDAERYRVEDLLDRYGFRLQDAL
ncbi:hypothetical protein H5V45_15375 [Nocardioides sp. KIGAM211]|uniref:Uncharacterized protein n=1 Tax=Nocardioides luti TaxID=2761101 RepID=A0A7X0VBH9_9ACTN|nr:hypothetical protein [Nocardioides luti]MBB6628706.1 hypothetical protein [Nocardioides luti]